MGPGSHLHRMIAAWTGQAPTLSCSCKSWISKMDRDPEWARSHVKLIAAKLMKEAQARALAWRAVPVDEGGRMLNAARTLAWTGAFLIPGSGVLLGPFVRRMVDAAIARADADREAAL